MSLMEFGFSNRPRISVENIREMLANGGYRRQVNGVSVPMERNEAMLVAMECAAENDHLDLIKEFVADGAAISQSTDALIAACEHGHLHIIEYFIDSGSPVNRHGRFGESPLMAAAGAGQFHAVKYLLTVGGDPDLLDTGTDTPMSALGWAKLGLAQESYDDLMTQELKNRYNQIIDTLKKLNADTDNAT